MDYILPAYHDPLFSIIIIIVISLVISVVTYGWDIHKQNKNEDDLIKFLDKFDGLDCNLNDTAMIYQTNMIQPLSLLSKAFETSGEYHKAINIYLYLIKNVTDDKIKIEIMERLGKTYLHAGFLERSQSIYLQILKTRPRNINILYDLGVVYEIMHEYKKAQETLLPLSILEEDTTLLENFWNFLSISNNKTISSIDKLEKFKILLYKEANLYRDIFTCMLNIDTKEAWNIFDIDRVDEVIDILWYLSNTQLDLDIISTNKSLQTIFYLKGYVQDTEIESGIFNIDLLAVAKKNGFIDTELRFSYLCNKCKQNFPVSFRRCPNCMSILSVKVETKIAPKELQRDYSLL